MAELKVIQGGKVEDDTVELKLAGSGPTGHDWLRELGYGAQFVCHPKMTKGVFLNKFAIAFVLDECLLLAEDLGLPMPKFHWVDSLMFSHSYKLVAVLPEPDTEAGNKDGRNLLGPADSGHDD